MTLIKMLFPRIPKEKDINKREKALIRRLVARFVDNNYYLCNRKYITKRDHEELKARVLKYKF